MEQAERRLEDAIRRVDPELIEYLRRDVRSRARGASILALAQVREATRRRRPPSPAYLELLDAAAPWLAPRSGETWRKKSP